MAQPYPGLVTTPTETVPFTKLLHPADRDALGGWRRTLQVVGSFLLSIVVSAWIVILTAIAVSLAVYFVVWMVFEVTGW